MNRNHYRAIAQLAQYYKLDYAAIRRSYGYMGLFLILFWATYYAALRQINQSLNKLSHVVFRTKRPI